jgi:hypothetical protein
MLFSVVTRDSASAWRDLKVCQHAVDKVCKVTALSYIEKFRHILVVVPFFLLVRDIDRNQVGVLPPSALRGCYILACITFVFRISLSCCWYAECALVLPWSKELSIFFRLCSTS